MQRIMIATLMALFFGLFSMPASQAAPANGVAIGSAVKATAPLDKSSMAPSPPSSLRSPLAFAQSAAGGGNRLSIR